MIARSTQVQFTCFDPSFTSSEIIQPRRVFQAKIPASSQSPSASTALNNNSGDDDLHRWLVVFTNQF